MEKSSEIILRCLKESGISQTELATRMGTDRRNLNQILHRVETIKHEKFVEMLECMGYDFKLEKTNVVRVYSELLSKMMDSGEPKGKYWSFRENSYVGVINDGSGTRSQEFADKDDLMKWFREQ